MGIIIFLFEVVMAVGAVAILCGLVSGIGGLFWQHPLDRPLRKRK